MTPMTTRTPVTRPAPDLASAHDPGPGASAQRAAEALTATPPEVVGNPLVRSAGGEVRIGTASWTDPTMVRANVFYPRGASTAEERLRYYASQFSVVEVDATYYSLPERATSQLWAERTTAHFSFHVKAHALMTGQPTAVARLPKGLVDLLPARVARQSKIYSKDLPSDLLTAVWARFIGALCPLAELGKLGGVLLQYPRWFLPTPQSEATLADAAERLSDLPATVELRNTSWFDTTMQTARTLDMLRALGLTHVMVDGPQGLSSSVPRVPATTTPHLAMIRLHGRRSATWEAPDVPTVERYRYLYSRDELASWVPLIETAAREATRTIVFFNNCYGNYGATNARELIAALSA